MGNEEKILLSVRDLKTYFFTRRGVIKAVDGISFDLRQGEVLGLVGESGCGKSITCRSILRLVPSPGRIVSGEILFDGENLLDKKEKEIRLLRGRRISMILQDPFTSLNPVLRIGDQVAEAIQVAGYIQKRNLWKRVRDLLELLRFPAPETRLRDFPHQLSGGMNQRVASAIALSAMPSLLIADEPTTALDVMVQAHYLKVLIQLQQQFNLSTIFVTHDLGIVGALCDRVCIMYAGSIVEQTEAQELFRNPIHPYTVGLLNSLPKLNQRAERLPIISGEPPSLVHLPPGCSFSPRCSLVKPRCKEEAPPLRLALKNHVVRCWEMQ